MSQFAQSWPGHCERVIVRGRSSSGAAFGSVCDRPATALGLTPTPEDRIVQLCSRCAILLEQAGDVVLMAEATP